MEPMMIFGFVFIGLFGLAVGSFLNVLIYRIPRHTFFSSASSYCPHCNTKLRWFELIPVFSWIFLGGKCRTCKEKISFRYPFVELSNTVLWLLCYAFHGLQVHTFLYMIVCSLLIVAAFIDRDTDIVPFGLSITFVALGVIALICSIFLPEGIFWWRHLVGGAVMGGAFGIAALVSKERYVDRRDAEVMFGLGLMMGWKLGLFALIVGTIAFGVMILVRLGSAEKKRAIPLTPSIAIGAFCAILFGDIILNNIFPL